MKIPYTFVLLSSCVMISSAMAMIEPSDVEVKTSPTHSPRAATTTVEETADTTSTTTPAADTATRADNLNAQLNTTPPAFDPRAIADDANDASRQAIVRDADEDSSTGSDESSSDNDDDADDKTAEPAASTSSTSGAASTTATPSLTFTKIANQTSAGGAFEIKEFKSPQGTSHQRLKKGPSQLFNLATERQIFGEYWQALQKTVGDFVTQNKGDKSSFFIRPMTSLQECMRNIEEDVNYLLTCGDRIFDDRLKIQNVNEVLSGLSAYLVQADYYLWMSKSSKPSVIYPWMKAYPTFGIRDEDSDKGDNNIFKHLDKMTEADRTLHAQLPFTMYFSNISNVWSRTAKALADITEQRHPIVGENKWERPDENPLLAAIMRGLSRTAVESGNVKLMEAMIAGGDFDPAAPFGGGRNPFASLSSRPGMPNVAAMRAGSENREDDNGNQSDSDDEAAPTADGDGGAGASNSAPRGVQCAQQ